MFLKKLLRSKKGAALVEYGLLVAGVALVAAAAVTIFGTKTTDLIASIATVLPGAHAVDNGPITSGSLIETTEADTAGTPIEIDITGATGIGQSSGTNRLDTNIGIPIEKMIIDPEFE